MGRHSAPHDDEFDAATDTAPGAIAAGEGTRTSAPGGRHSSADVAEPDGGQPDGSELEVDEPEVGEPDIDEPDIDVPHDSSAGHGGLELIEQVLADPDSGPMPVGAPRRPAPGQPDTGEPAETAALQDAPTERIPAVGRVPEPAEQRTDRIPTVSGAVDTTTSELPWPGTATDGKDGTADVGVSEVGLDSAGPVVATPDPSTSARPVKAASPRRGTMSDFGLIRRHADVRARVIAAVVVPFVLFFGGFAVAGELTVRRLIWIWVPAVTAGVLVGLLLDAGHRRYPDPAPATAPADPSPEPRTR